jgi:hypothetical protein
MRRILGLALGLLVVLAAGAPAQAARLNWDGTLTSTTGELPPLNLFGGGVATVNGSAGGVPAHLNTLRIAVSRGGITGTDTNIITDPETIGNGIAAVILIGEGGTGTLAPISGVIGSMNPALTMNVLPGRGLSKICLLSTVCTDFIPLVLTQHTPGSMTIGVGIGGLLAVSQAAIRISLEAAPWTVKTATAIDQTDDNTGLAAFHNVTKMGFAHGPASLTTSTAGPSGVLQIVTPNQVRTNLALGTSEKIAVFGEILIHFIPEPGLLVLIGAGVAGLALIGARRMRK